MDTKISFKRYYTQGHLRWIDNKPKRGGGRIFFMLDGWMDERCHAHM